jgi:cytochrome c biogenesis protein ResB
LKIDENLSVVMTIPEVKKFTSEVSILQKNGERIETTIEVNKPFDFDGWKIYQLSYNEKMGKWSNTSVLELVKDPWLPYVYIGIFMMIAGAINMFWVGNKFKKENNHDVD